MGDDYNEMQFERDSESDYEEFTYTDLYTSESDRNKKNQKFKMSMFKFDSFQSADTNTSRSTVGSVIEVLQSREIDAKAFLREIFGPSTKKRRQTSVPTRFLIPSQCEGVSIEKFIENEIKRQCIRECTSSGFRGLLETAETKQHPALGKLVDLLCTSMNTRMYGNCSNSTVWSQNSG